MGNTSYDSGLESMMADEEEVLVKSEVQEVSSRSSSSHVVMGELDYPYLQGRWLGGDIDTDRINLNWDRDCGLPDCMDVTKMEVDEEVEETRLQEVKSVQVETGVQDEKREGENPPTPTVEDIKPSINVNTDENDNEFSFVGVGKCVVHSLPPETEISSFIEGHVNRVAGIATQKVYVRIVACLQKVFELKPILQKFVQSYGGAVEFPYRSRVLLCFQETKGGYVAFFAAYFQEYGETCPMPNQKVAYLAMIDSANVFNPATKKRLVIYSVLLCYIEYMRNLDYRHIFLWSCPPQAGVEYVFNKRPESQKIPNDCELRDWYGTLMGLALDSGCLSSISNWDQYCRQDRGNKFSLKRIPLFFEDHWPLAIENVITEKMQQMKIEDLDAFFKLPTVPFKRPMRKNRKSSIQKLSIYDFVQKEIASEMQSIKENFLCLTLKPKLFPNEDLPDYIIPSLFLESRDNLVSFFRDNDLKFSNVDEAEKSTKQILGEFCQETKNVYAMCDVCTCGIKQGGYSCKTCAFDICNSCVSNNYTHEHKLGRIIDTSSNNHQQSDHPDIINWRTNRQTFWSWFQDNLVETNSMNQVLLKLLLHLKNCDSYTCTDCMRIRDFGYTHINEILLQMSKFEMTDPHRPTRRRNDNESACNRKI